MVCGRLRPVPVSPSLSAGRLSLSGGQTSRLRAGRFPEVRRDRIRKNRRLGVRWGVWKHCCTVVLCSHPRWAPVICTCHPGTYSACAVCSHTYSLQCVYQLPPSVTTLGCSNLVPLPPDPPPLFFLFGGLKINQKKKPILNAHPANFCHISSWLFSTIPLAKRERQKDGGGDKKKKFFLAVYAGNTDLLGGGADSLFSSGVKMLHHWHGLVEHVNAHFFFLFFFFKCNLPFHS